MAARKPASSVEESSNKTADVPLSASLSLTDDTAVFYINFAEVSASIHEFTILAARAPTTVSQVSQERIQDAAKTGKITFNADIQLIVPPTVIPGLIRALKTTQENFEKLPRPKADE